MIQIRCAQWPLRYQIYLEGPGPVELSIALVYEHLDALLGRERDIRLAVVRQIAHCEGAGCSQRRFIVLRRREVSASNVQQHAEGSALLVLHDDLRQFISGQVRYDGVSREPARSVIARVGESSLAISQRDNHASIP